MQIIKLYKYNRAGGGVTVSPNKPECDFVEMVRLVADEGKVLVNGDVITSCIDTDKLIEDWEEVDEPVETSGVS